MTTFRVIVNDRTGSRFYPTRDIQQSDPLSPYSFIICARYLGKYIHFMANQKKSGIGKD